MRCATLGCVVQPLRGKNVGFRSAKARPFAERKATNPAGFTLAELLVVVMIMVILLSIAIPLLKPALEDRKVREASRQINAFFAAARSRAVELNRPVGVWFSRTDNTNPNISYQLYFAETPAPYVGDTTSARAAFFILDDFIPPNNPMGTWIKWHGFGRLSDSWSAAVGANASEYIVQIGDLIQINGTGPRYVITSVTFNATLNTTDFTFEAPNFANNGQPTDPHASLRTAAPRNLNSGPGADGEWGKQGVDDDGVNGNGNIGEMLWTGSDDIARPVRFSIHRKPQRSSAGSLTLPNGTAVILSLSGFNGALVRDPMTSTLLSDEHEFAADLSVAADTSPVIVMFRPDGNIERVYYDTDHTDTFSIASPELANIDIHFLVGSSIVDERLPPAAYTPTSPLPTTQDQLTWQNLNDLRNLWVTIGHRTGTVTTSSMQDWQAWYNTADPNCDTLVQKTRDARRLTVGAVSTGGK